MRGIMYVLILASLFFVPLERVRISQMMPVTAIAVQEEEGVIVLKTDGDVVGEGESVAVAVETMKKNASAVIYLDTAKYLLVAENAAEHVEDLRIHLKDSVKVCLTDKQDDIKGIIKYLDVHGDLPKLKDWKYENVPVENN